MVMTTDSIPNSLKAVNDVKKFIIRKLKVYFQKKPQSAGTYGGVGPGDERRKAAGPKDSTGEAVPMPCCMNAASGARGRRANGTARAIFTRLPTNCGKK